MADNHTNTWTDEVVAKLKERWADGWSGGAIAQELGLTRNAVMSKICRSGLQRGTGATYGKTAIPLPRRGKTRQRPFVLDTARFLRDIANSAFDAPVELPPSLPPVTAVFFHELEPHHCRFPYGHTPDMLFCGAIATHGPYCAAHHAVTHISLRPRTVKYWRAA